MCAMQPVTNKFLAGTAFALRNLGLVVRKDVVNPTAVNVDFVAK